MAADPQLKDAICAAVSLRLPMGWKIIASEFFDCGAQVGVCIQHEAQEALPPSERRRWASRANLSDPEMVDTMIERLSRAWS